MAAFPASTSKRGTVLAWSLTAAMLCAGRPAVGEDAAYTLRYKFRPEQFLYLEVEDTMKIVTQFNGASETITSKSQAWKQLRVVSTGEDGSALLEPMMERVKLFADRGNQGTEEYDSLSDETPPVNYRELKGTIGRVQARMKVAANGELIQVIPVVQNPALIEAAKKNDPQLNFLTILPKAPVRIGESWKDRFTTDVTIEKNLKKDVVIQRTYTLTAVNGATATIKLKTAVITPTDDPQILVQLIQRTPNGVIEFDMNQGLIVSMKTEIDETVLGPFGPKSSVTTTTRSSEKLLPRRPEFKTVSQTTNAVK